MSGDRVTWRVGDRLPELALPPVGRLELIRYAGASGDYNPIHTIDDEAARAGLPGVIQHGMLTMAQMAVLFSPYLEHGFVRSLATRFVGMVLLGDALRIDATVIRVDAAPAGDAYTFDLRARVGSDRVVATGTAEFLVFRVTGNA